MSLICCFVCLSKAACLAWLTCSASSPVALAGFSVVFLVAICCVLRSAVTPLTFSAKVLTTVRGSGGRPIVRASSADSAAIRSERATAALGGGGGGSGAAGPSGSSKREPAGRKAPPAVPACALRSAA